MSTRTVNLPDRLLTAEEVADLLAVSEEWVREHAAELGAIRLGGSPRAPLRFERRCVAERLERWRLEPEAPSGRSRHAGGQRRAAAGVDLLPLPNRR